MVLIMKQAVVYNSVIALLAVILLAGKKVQEMNMFFLDTVKEPVVRCFVKTSALYAEAPEPILGL